MVRYKSARKQFYSNRKMYEYAMFDETYDFIATNRLVIFPLVELLLLFRLYQLLAQAGIA